MHAKVEIEISYGYVLLSINVICILPIQSYYVLKID